MQKSSQNDQNSHKQFNSSTNANIVPTIVNYNGNQLNLVVNFVESD